MMNLWKLVLMIIISLGEGKLWAYSEHIDPSSRKALGLGVSLSVLLVFFDKHLQLSQLSGIGLALRQNKDLV